MRSAAFRAGLDAEHRQHRERVDAKRTVADLSEPVVLRETLTWRSPLENYLFKTMARDCLRSVDVRRRVGPGLTRHDRCDAVGSDGAGESAGRRRDRLRQPAANLE